MLDKTKSPRTAPFRVLVIDDHPLMREGLSARIATQPDMEVCGEADNVRDALAQVKSRSPDLVIVDIQLNDSHGMDLVKEVHQHFSRVKMLVVSAFDESLYAERSLRAGADGYINKRELQDNVLEALRTVLGGRRYLSPRMTQEMLRKAIRSKDADVMDPVGELSDRELEVFQLIGQGVTTGAIARRLHLSVHTIDTYREKLKAKLGLSNSVELTRDAVQWVLENG